MDTTEGRGYEADVRGAGWEAVRYVILWESLKKFK